MAGSRQHIHKKLSDNGTEQADARERRSRADLHWRMNRRRPVIGDVLSLGDTYLQQ
jgi:hypothetical protein